jgi:serine/threonine protein kinase
VVQVKKIGEKYILLDLIGIGGMAEVYRSKLLRDKGFEKQIVIKKLLPQIAQDKEMVRLFIGEARLAALLQHENIAATYDFGENDGNFFLAMEYLSGKDLYTVLQRTKEFERPLELKFALMVASKICEGMDYAHRLKDLKNNPLNIIHRDLTPHNIFITYDGKVKILDFGVAKAEILDNRTQVGVVKGKLSYMSPEQLSGEVIDFRSDIFSIGILLYEMLSGKRMYSGSTAELIKKCINVDYELIKNIVPDLPPKLYAILDKALSRDLDSRYQSCADMQADIDDLLFNMAERPDPKSLQNCIRVLFAQEFESDQAKPIMATEGTADSTSDPSIKKTKDSEPDSSEKTIAYNTHPKTGVGNHSHLHHRFNFQLLTNKPFIFIGSLCLVALIAISFPVLFKKNNIIVSSPSTRQDVIPSPIKESKDSIKKNDYKPLLLLAQKALEEDRLLTPKNDCAFKYYSEILKLNPDNILAQNGLTKIGERYATLAKLAYKEFNLEEANHLVEFGLQAVPKHEQLRDLKTELAELTVAKRYSGLANKALTDGKIVDALRFADSGLSESPSNKELIALKAHIVRTKEAKIANLAEKARRCLYQDKLTTPVDDSALIYYKAIKKVDPDSTIASAGFQDIANRYAVLAEKAYRKFTFDAAGVYVNKGLKVAPSHPRLLRLKAELTKSSPEKIVKGLGKNIEALFSN